MRRTQLLYDGLWRCLCPAFDEHVLSRTTKSTFVRSLTKRSPARSLSRQSRPYGTDTPRVATLTKESSSNFSIPTSASVSSSKPQRSAEQDRREPTNAAIKRILQGEFEGSSTDDVTATLQILRDPSRSNQSKGVPDRQWMIVKLVTRLLMKLDHPITPFIYESMMDAMVDPKGSALGIGGLLKDMAKQGIAPTETLCNSAIQALAVHPDYVLRQQVLETMKDYWFVTNTPTEKMTTLAMLREGQYERAYESFIALRESHVPTELWLYDIFLVVFGQEGFLDEMLQILQHRKHAKGTDSPFRSLLVNCLDLFSQSFHHDGTSFVWDSAVKNSLINPSNAVVENVLATAARHGDTKLATEALDIISSRGRVMKFHYESVMDAFAGSGDMAGAFKIFTIMEESGLAVGRASTRTIFQSMIEEPNLIGDAVLAMRETVDNQKRVHPEALCVTLEAMVRSNPSGADALALYDDWFLLTGQEPSLVALRDLLVNSYDAQTVYKLTKVYTARMGEDVGYENPKIYDRAIKVCVDRGDFDIAFNLAGRNIEASKNSRGGKQLWRDRLWVPYLVDKALAAQDDRVWGLVDSVNQVNDKMAEQVSAIMTRRKMAAKIAKTQPSTKLEEELWKQSGDGKVVDLIGPKSPVKESQEALEKLYKDADEEAAPSFKRVSEKILTASKRASDREFERASERASGSASKRTPEREFRRASRRTSDSASKRAPEREFGSRRSSRDGPQKASKPTIDNVSDPFAALQSARKTV